MTFKTRQELVASVYNELALVAGSSVQTYTQPQVEECIQDAFEHLFKKHFWTHLTTTTFHTLDGAGGVVTDSILGLEDVTDIKWIRQSPYEESDQVHYFEDGIFNSDMLAFTSLTYGETGYDTKRIKFNPVTSEAEIAIRARRKPDPFENEDVVPLDYVMIKHLVTSNLLATDGMNPSAEARQLALFEDRYDTLISNRSNHALVTTSTRFQSEFTVAD